MMRRMLQRLRADRQGVTIIEFAIVMPVMLVMLMGFGELAYEVYVRSVLAGAIQKAGRDTTIRGASLKTATIDAAVLAEVRNVAPAATYASPPSRKSYEKFGYITAEPFTDADGDGVRESGECFTDLNGNGIWDADPGVSGTGGDGDAVVYSVTITYPRVFPIFALLGWPDKATTSDTTVLKNQPYKAQATTTPQTVCT
jgi:Flp pilus assembly protein TadG